MRDGQWVKTAGLVLIRQRPGSAKGVLFVTLEDESGFNNLVIWPKLFEEMRPTIFGSKMVGVKGRIQREGDVVHLIARELYSMNDDLASVGNLNESFTLRHGRGDEFHHGGPPEPQHLSTRGIKSRDIYIPDLHIDSIKVKTRDFR